MTTNPALNRALQAAAVIASFVLTAFAIELGAGRVPLPDQWQWTVPIINAAVTGMLIFLPRPGSEHLARDVDRLREQGVPKSRMVVLSDAEAARSLSTSRPRTEVDALAERIAALGPGEQARLRAMIEAVERSGV